MKASLGSFRFQGGDHLPDEFAGNSFCRLSPAVSYNRAESPVGPGREGSRSKEYTPSKPLLFPPHGGSCNALNCEDIGSGGISIQFSNEHRNPPSCCSLTETTAVLPPMDRHPSSLRGNKQRVASLQVKLICETIY